ncbi:MAG: hypothetical protein NVSMB9_25200 [Isosphaeraceae bacterium]
MQMGRKVTGQAGGNTPGMPEDVAPSQKSVKVTLHLSVETAQRLGIESAMRRVSQSAIGEEVLAGYLSRWKLPSTENSARNSANPGVKT